MDRIGLSSGLYSCVMSQLPNLPICIRSWLLGIFATAALSLITFGCQESVLPDPPDMATIPIPETVRVGVAAGAQQLAFIGLSESATLSIGYTLAEGDVLRSDVKNGVLDGAFVYIVPEGEFWFNPVVVDGIVLIVHPDNPVQQLALPKVRQIYSGEITNWSAVGGRDALIELLVPGRATDIRTIFNERVMGAQRVSINAEVSPTPDSLIKAVMGNPNAIGVATVGAIKTEDQVRLLQIDQSKPNPNQLAQQIYPLALPVYWISLQEPQGAARGVLAILQSGGVQENLGGVFGRIR